MALHAIQMPRAETMREQLTSYGGWSFDIEELDPTLKRLSLQFRTPNQVVARLWRDLKMLAIDLALTQDLPDSETIFTQIRKDIPKITQCYAELLSVDESDRQDFAYFAKKAYRDRELQEAILKARRIKRPPIVVEIIARFKAYESQILTEERQEKNRVRLGTHEQTLSTLQNWPKIQESINLGFNLYRFALPLTAYSCQAMTIAELLRRVDKAMQEYSVSPINTAPIDELRWLIPEIAEALCESSPSQRMRIRSAFARMQQQCIRQQRREALQIRYSAIERMVKRQYPKEMHDSRQVKAEIRRLKRWSSYRVIQSAKTGSRPMGKNRKHHYDPGGNFKRKSSRRKNK